VLPGYWGEHELREKEACTAEAKRWIVFLTLILPLESGLLPGNLRILRKWCFIQFVRGINDVRRMWGERGVEDTLEMILVLKARVLPVKRFLTLFAAIFVLHLLLYYTCIIFCPWKIFGASLDLARESLKEIMTRKEERKRERKHEIEVLYYTHLLGVGETGRRHASC